MIPEENGGRLVWAAPLGPHAQDSLRLFAGNCSTPIILLQKKIPSSNGAKMFNNLNFNINPTIHSNYPP